MIFLLPFLIAFGLALALCPITIILAKKYKFLDDPKVHRHPAMLHKVAVPRAGGIPLFFAFLIASITTVSFSKNLVGILAGAFLLTFVGILDDKFDLKTWHKFAGQIAAALIVVASGIGISFITNPLLSFGQAGLGEVIRLDGIRIAFNFFGAHSILLVADLFAIFWIVWVVNMVNFSAGVDGQMPGIVLVALVVIFAASLRLYPGDPTQIFVAKLAAIGAGATLAFLLFNYSPAKIFPGDSGSYFLGFLVSVLAIVGGAKVGTAILVMAVPFIDGAFTITRRLAAGKSPFVGDRGHLHHRLLEIGLTSRQVALFYWLLCAILGAIALILPAVEKVFAGVIVAIIILGGLLWLNMNLQKEARS